MQARVGLLDTDVMPMFMIMPRYHHNYAIFYQLLDSNLFTHRNTYAILRESTSETYGPRVYLLSYLSDLTLVSVEGLTTPLSRWLRGSCLFV